MAEWLLRFCLILRAVLHIHSIYTDIYSIDIRVKRFPDWSILVCGEDRAGSRDISRSNLADGILQTGRFCCFVCTMRLQFQFPLAIFYGPSTNDKPQELVHVCGSGESPAGARAENEWH